ncbi:hypothetical protein ALC62_09855 [Cyphomyrmex costatus]|uniref:Uncharacterized protein n=1 Tax=Cyphomyrmex costatus TaxID=456900 RepID=A0A151IEX2_9HYME|nr:hypothetical protein ALC62_09855 [Cyphomyrmex costatus]
MKEKVTYGGRSDSKPACPGASNLSPSLSLFFNREAELCQEISLRVFSCVQFFFIRIIQNFHLEKLRGSDNLQKFPFLSFCGSSFSSDSSEARKPKWVHQNRVFQRELSVCLRIPKDETTRSTVSRFYAAKCVVLEILRFLVENPMIFHFSIFSHRIRHNAGIRSFEYSGLTQMIISGGVISLSWSEVDVIERTKINVRSFVVDLKRKGNLAASNFLETLQTVRLLSSS